MKSVSLVVPVYNEEPVLGELLRRIEAVVTAQASYRWEVILVNDGSTDHTEASLATLLSQYPWLTVIHLSRNFGHQLAISAGLNYAQGDAVILMDGDLQDPPEVIPELLLKWEQGFDVAYATREEREGEGTFKTESARWFYRLLQKMTDVPIPLDTGDFRLMDRKVVDVIQRMRERNRFVRGMVSWVGYRQTPVLYKRARRHDGQTKYTFWKMARFAMDGLVSFSRVPLHLITTLGFFISISSFLGIVGVLFLKLIDFRGLEPGWSSIMIGILMLGGIQLICLGMIGEYVGRIYEEVQGRPLYLIRNVEGARLPASPAEGLTP